MVVRAGYHAAAAPASCNSSRVGWVWLPWVNRGSTGPGMRRMASWLSSQGGYGRAYHVNVGLALVGEAAFHDILEGGSGNAGIVAAGYDDEVRVVLHFGVHGGPQLAHHLLDGNAAAAGAGLGRVGLVLQVSAGDTGADVLLHRFVNLDGVAVAGVHVNEGRDVDGVHDFPGIVHHVAHTGAALGQPHDLRRGVAARHVESLEPQNLGHLRPHGVHAAGQDENLRTLEQLLEPGGHALFLWHHSSPLRCLVCGPFTNPGSPE